MPDTPRALQVSYFRAPKSPPEDAAEQTVVEVAGEIHLPNAGQLDQALQPIISDHAGCVLLDLRQVSFLDSAGLKVILALRKRLSLQSRSLTLRLCADSQPDRAMRTSRLNSIIPLVYE